jgi:hypothetical protein
MKNIIIIALILNCFLSFGQVNLVPNPSFEDTLECNGPFDLTVKNWQSFKESPDYYSYFCTPDMISSLGGKEPNTGNAYSGFISYNLGNPPNIREFLGVELISPLIIGQKYFVSYYLSVGYTPNAGYNIAINNIGAIFTTNTFYNMANPNFAHLKANQIVSDFENWIKISGSFIADSTYSYLMLGNFFDDIYTDTLELSSSVQPHRSYSLVDDVCVTSDSLYNEQWTGQTTENKMIDKKNIKFYPNPTDNLLNIKSDQLISSIQIINSVGQIIYCIENIFEKLLILDVSQFKKGYYLFKLNQVDNQTILTNLIIN